MNQKYTEQVSELAVNLLPLLIQHSTGGEGEDSLNNYVHPIKALSESLITALTCDRAAWARIVNAELVDEIYNSDIVVEAYKAGEQQLGADVFFKSLDSESCYAIAQFGSEDPHLYLLFYKEFPPDKIDTGKWLLNSLFTGRSNLCTSDPSWSKKLTVNSGRVRAMSVDSERSDGSYWDQYGDEDEEDKDKEKIEEPQSDGDYYARYDNVETAVGDGQDHEHKAKDMSPLEAHINETLYSLKKLALSNGMSAEEFSSIVMRHAGTAG
jgi:hypothetical protein